MKENTPLHHAALAENIGKWTHVAALTLYVGRAFLARKPQLLAKLPLVLRSPKTSLMCWGVSGFASSTAYMVKEVASAEPPKEFTTVKQGINIAGMALGAVSFVTLKHPVFRMAALSSLWCGSASGIIDDFNQKDKTHKEQVGLAANVLNSAGLATSILRFPHVPYVLWAKAGIVNGVGNVIEKFEQDNVAALPVTAAEKLGYAGIVLGSTAVAAYTLRACKRSSVSVESAQAVALLALGTKAVDSGVKSASAWQLKIAQEKLAKVSGQVSGKAA